MVSLGGEADELEQRQRGERRIDLSARGSGREGDVLEGGEVGQEIRSLEDIRDPVGPHRAASGCVHTLQGFFMPFHAACGRLDQTAQHVEQRRFA